MFHYRPEKMMDMRGIQIWQLGLITKKGKAGNGFSFPVFQRLRYYSKAMKFKSVMLSLTGKTLASN